jgi:hypothetical protein
MNARMQKILTRKLEAPLSTPADLVGAVTGVIGAMNSILADLFAFYVRTKNFHFYGVNEHYVLASLPCGYPRVNLSWSRHARTWIRELRNFGAF